METGVTMATGICGNQKVTRTKVKYARALRKRMTPSETVLWDHLRDRRCDGYKFRRQQIVLGFIADFYCEQAQLVVELDGSVHDTDRAKAYDAHRNAVFLARGIKTVRFKNDEIETDVESVVKKIAELCRVNLRPSALTEWEKKRALPL